jgi:hypothetical protein
MVRIGERLSGRLKPLLVRRRPRVHRGVRLNLEEEDSG